VAFWKLQADNYSSKLNPFPVRWGRGYRTAFVAAAPPLGRNLGVLGTCWHIYVASLSTSDSPQCASVFQPPNHGWKTRSKPDWSRLLNPSWDVAIVRISVDETSRLWEIRSSCRSEQLPCNSPRRGVLKDRYSWPTYTSSYHQSRKMQNEHIGVDHPCENRINLIYPTSTYTLDTVRFLGVSLAIMTRKLEQVAEAYIYVSSNTY
jgi:hypothetical protein